MRLKRLATRSLKLGRLVRRNAYRRGLRHGVAAAIEHEDALRSLAIRSLLDVGANKGQFSLAAKAVHPDLVIHAFEPLSEPAETYAALFAGDERVQLHRVAAGEAAGEATINVSRQEDSSSLLPISQRQSQIFPGTELASQRTIQVAALDEVLNAALLPRPLMIKLDVQGFELAALKGMPRLLGHADYVYAEVSFVTLYTGQPLADEIVRWLADRGMKLAGVHNPSSDAGGAAVQADFLFRADRLQTG